MKLPEGDARPKYQVMADYIRARILEGIWEPGEKVSSTNELAAQFGVTATTANAALRQLKQEGFLIGRQGAGTFVAPKDQRIEAAKRRLDLNGRWYSGPGPVTIAEYEKELARWAETAENIDEFYPRYARQIDLALHGLQREYIEFVEQDPER